MTVQRFKVESEEQALEYFWTVAGQADVDRIELLRKLAAAVIVSSRVDLASVREWSKRTREYFRLDGDQCFACRSAERVMVWHHVVQVQHGGSDRVQNQVPLCEGCHARVHPWLPQVYRIKSGFTKVGDMIGAYTDKLVRRWPQSKAR